MEAVKCAYTKVLTKPDVYNIDIIIEALIKASTYVSNADIRELSIMLNEYSTMQIITEKEFDYIFKKVSKIHADTTISLKNVMNNHLAKNSSGELIEIYASLEKDVLQASRDTFEDFLKTYSCSIESYKLIQKLINDIYSGDIDATWISQYLGDIKRMERSAS